MSAPSYIPRNATIHQLQVVLELGDKKIPVVAAMAEYVLNQIPSATVKIPSGVTADLSGNEVLLTPEDLQGRKRARLYVIGQAGDPHPQGIKLKPSAPAYRELLFDGYIQSASVSVSTGGSSTVISLVGRLSDLDITAFGSGDFDRSTPSDWFTTRVKRNVEGTGFALYREPNEGKIVRTDEYLSSNWWTDILQPAMITAATSPLANFFGGQSVDSNNDRVESGLERIGSENLKLLDSVKPAFGVAGVLTQMHDQFVSLISAGQGGATAFEKLLMLFSPFGVVLSPRPPLNSSASIAELMPYRPVGEVDMTIDATAFDLGAASPNPVRLPIGTIMYGGSGRVSVANTPQEPTKIETRFVGQYNLKVPAGDEEAYGGWLVIPTPPYLYNTMLPGFGGFEFDARQGLFPISQPPTSNSAALASNLASVKPLGDALAKQAYFNTVYSSKTQDVIFGFALDFAPGMRLKYTFPANKISGLNSSNACVGIVESVTYNFSAESAVVNTILRMRHVMNDADVKLFDDLGDGAGSAPFQTLFDYKYDFSTGLYSP
jgi:hypothetical protein